MGRASFEPPREGGLAALSWIFAGLSLAWGLWWLAFWPGLVGQDSLAVMLQVEGRPDSSGKALLWYLMVKALYGPTGRVEAAVAVHVLLGAMVYSRILWWCWAQGLRKTFAFVAVFVCLAPPVLYYQTSLYSDGPFATAVAGLLFEAWLVVRRGTASRGALAWLAVLLPMALFFRANGIFMLAILVPLLWGVDRRSRIAIAGLAVAWLLVFGIAGRMNREVDGHGTLYPLALFETVNFLQPRPMGLRTPQSVVTPQTRHILERYQPIPFLVSYYDRDYWDPLVYRAGGPAMLYIEKQDKKALVRQFFCCNVWMNLPAFLSSRVNVFMVAVMAQGGFGLPEHSPILMALTKSRSAPGLEAAAPLRGVLLPVYHWSHSVGWFLWSPLVGVALAAALAVRGWRRRDRLLVLLVAPLGLQLAGIFFFSIAGEYRYLLPFLTATAALAPMLAAERRRQPAALHATGP